MTLNIIHVESVGIVFLGRGLSKDNILQNSVCLCVCVWVCEYVGPEKAPEPCVNMVMKLLQVIQ